MAELKDLPVEEPVALPLTPSEESTIDDIVFGQEVTIKTEALGDLPMSPSQASEIRGDSETEVTIQTETSFAPLTPIDSPISSSASEETIEEEEDEKVEEEMPENGRDGEDTSQSSAATSLLDATPAVPISKTDSRPRNTRATRSAAAESFPFRVTKAIVRKGGR